MNLIAVNWFQWLVVWIVECYTNWGKHEETTLRTEEAKRRYIILVEERQHAMIKNQRHTTNKKPNMCKDINKDNQYFGLSNRLSSG